MECVECQLKQGYTCFIVFEMASMQLNKSLTVIWVFPNVESRHQSIYWNKQYVLVWVKHIGYILGTMSMSRRATNVFFVQLGYLCSGHLFDLCPPWSQYIYMSSQKCLERKCITSFPVPSLCFLLTMRSSYKGLFWLIVVLLFSVEFWRMNVCQNVYKHSFIGEKGFPSSSLLPLFFLGNFASAVSFSHKYQSDLQ